MKKFLLSLAAVALCGSYAFADEWKAVTKADDLEDGGKYLIVSGTTVMGAQNGNYRDAIKNVTTANGTISETPEGAAIVTLKKNETNWSLCVDDNKYLSWTSGNTMITSETELAWNISTTVNATKIVVLTTLNGDKRTINYNASYSRYACYKPSSNQATVQLYKLTSVDNREAVTLSFPEAEYTASLGTPFAAPELTVTPDAVKSLVKYASSNEEIAKVDATTGEVTPLAAGTATISATFEGNDTYKNASAKYELTVIDPSSVTVAINPAFFNYTGAYAAKSKTDDYGVTYSAVFNGGTTGYLQLNTNNDNGKGSGVNITANNSDYIIKSIDLDFDTAGKGVDVYSYDGVFTALATKTAPTIPAGATKVGEAVKASNSVTINARSFAVVPAGSGTIKVAITVHYAAADPSKTTPKLSFAEETVTVNFEAGKTMAAQAVTSDTEGLTYTWSSSRPEVATIDAATGEITLVGAGETAISVKSAGTDKLNEGNAAYTLVVEKAYNSFADIYANAADGETVKINFPMTVGYVNGNNCYVADNNGGYGLIYIRNVDLESSFAEGDIIAAGWTSDYTVYNGLPELTTQPTVSGEKGTYTIETVEASALASQPICKIVKVKNVVIAAATPDASSNFEGTAGETTIAFRNNFRLASVEAGTYDVTMVCAHYTKNATEVATPNQYFPTAYEVVAPAPAPWIVDQKETYAVGDEIYLQVADPSVQKIYFTLDGSNVVIPGYGEVELPAAPAAAPRREADTYSPTGTNLYNGTPIKFEGEDLNLNAVAYEEGKAPSEVVTLNVNANGETTGIENVAVDAENAPAEYFNLQGIRVANPENGIFIRRQGNKVSKVIL